MSASREKRERKQYREEHPEEFKKRTKKRRARAGHNRFVGRVAAIVLAVVLVLGLGYLVVDGLGVPQRASTALTVGGVKVSPAEYNFYYLMIYNEYYRTYGSDYISLVEASILEQTDQTIQTSVIMAGEAEAAGMTLSEDNRKIVEDNIAAIKGYADSQKQSVRRFLSDQYGAGMDMATFEKSLSRQLLAEQWMKEKYDSFTYTQADIDAHYEENKDTMDTVDYRSYYIAVPVAGEEATDEEKAQLTADTRAKADAFDAAVTDEDSFADLALEYASDETKENYEEKDATLQEWKSLGSLSGDAQAWFADAARKEGDHTVIEISSGCYIYYFIRRHRVETERVDVRHILISLDPNGDGTDVRTDEEAKALADEVYAQWQAGDADEDSFAALAEERSDDSGSVESGGGSGGLYTGVGPGQMVRPFSDWCFNPARKPGDTGIVGTTYGYHIMYFVDRHEKAGWAEDAENALREADYTAYAEALAEANPIEKNRFGMGLTIAPQPSPSPSPEPSPSPSPETEEDSGE